MVPRLSSMTKWSRVEGAWDEGPVSHLSQEGCVIV